MAEKELKLALKQKKKEQHKCQRCRTKGKKSEMKKCAVCKHYTHLDCLEDIFNNVKFVCHKC